MTAFPSLYSVAQVRQIDAHVRLQQQLSNFQLMMRAAEYAVAYIILTYPDIKRITVACGKGHNAGDGYLVATLLHKAGYNVEVLAVIPPIELQAEVLQAAQLYQHQGGVIITNKHEVDTNTELWIDALLGTGLNRVVNTTFQAIIELINHSLCVVIALDVPSGLSADTGCCIGGEAIKATVTLTFIVYKQGLFTGSAVDYCGEIVLLDLQLITEAACNVFLLNNLCLPPRKKSSYKTCFGHVLLVGGDYGYAGSVQLAAEASLRSGAGLVSVATRREYALSLHLKRPELMSCAVDTVADIEDVLNQVTVLALGMGLGKGDWGIALWNRLIDSNMPRVIDADGLNLLAETPRYSEHWVLTPHVGEAARLLNCTNQDVMSDRFAAVTELQQRYGGVCLLKGAGTLIFDGKQLYVNRTGNAGMATAGMGDVLSGLIAGFIAQKQSLLAATLAGVYFQGSAADKAVLVTGERGLLASDVCKYFNQVVN